MNITNITNNSSPITLHSLPFPSHPFHFPPSPQIHLGVWRASVAKPLPQTYFDAFTALKTHVVATVFTRLYATQLTVLCSLEFIVVWILRCTIPMSPTRIELVLFLRSEKKFPTFLGGREVTSHPLNTAVSSL